MCMNDVYVLHLLKVKRLQSKVLKGFCKTMWVYVCASKGTSTRSHIFGLQACDPFGYKLSSSAQSLEEGRGPQSVWEVPSRKHISSERKLHCPGMMVEGSLIYGKSKGL